MRCIDNIVTLKKKKFRFKLYMQYILRTFILHFCEILSDNL